MARSANQVSCCYIGHDWPVRKQKLLRNGVRRAAGCSFFERRLSTHLLTQSKSSTPIRKPCVVKSSRAKKKPRRSIQRLLDFCPVSRSAEPNIPWLFDLFQPTSSLHCSFSFRRCPAKSLRQTCVRVFFIFRGAQEVCSLAVFELLLVLGTQLLQL